MSGGERLNLALPGLSLAYQLYAAVTPQLGGRDGTQALAKLSAVDWEER